MIINLPHCFGHLQFHLPQCRFSRHFLYEDLRQTDYWFWLPNHLRLPQHRELFELTGLIFVIVDILMNCFCRHDLALLHLKRISKTDCSRSNSWDLSDAESPRCPNDSLLSAIVLVQNCCSHLFGPPSPIATDWPRSTLSLVPLDWLWTP